MLANGAAAACHHCFVDHLPLWVPLGVAVIVCLLTLYTEWADREINRGRGWRGKLAVRTRRHPTILAVQVLCVVVLLATVIVEST